MLPTQGPGETCYKIFPAWGESVGCADGLTCEEIISGSYAYKCIDANKPPASSTVAPNTEAEVTKTTDEMADTTTTFEPETSTQENATEELTTAFATETKKEYLTDTTLPSSNESSTTEGKTTKITPEKTEDQDAVKRTEVTRQEDTFVDPVKFILK